MGLFDRLGSRRPRDEPLPEAQDSVRDSAQTFLFGRAESGEQVDEHSSMQIAKVTLTFQLNQIKDIDNFQIH